MFHLLFLCNVGCQQRTIFPLLVKNSVKNIQADKINIDFEPVGIQALSFLLIGIHFNPVYIIHF